MKRLFLIGLWCLWAPFLWLAAVAAWWVGDRDG